MEEPLGDDAILVFAHRLMQARELLQQPIIFLPTTGYAELAEIAQAPDGAAKRVLFRNLQRKEA